MEVETFVIAAVSAAVVLVIEFFFVEKLKENKKFPKLTLQKRTAQLFPQRTCFRGSHAT
jgi:hypothetical protein